MLSFLETIRIIDGSPQHLDWHQRRVNATLAHFYPLHMHSWELEKCIDLPSEHAHGIVRCRIEYDAHHFSAHYYAYTPGQISTLRVTALPDGADYSFKFADRSFIEELFNLRTDSDDILMTKDGWITDTSIANIAFRKNKRWFTPSLPLLAGTTWKRLVYFGKLIPRPIHIGELSQFDYYRVFNAMNDFETAPEYSVENINYHG